MLPKITNPNPVSIPAVEAADFNEAYLVRTNVALRPTGKQHLTLTLRPYNYDSDKMWADESKDADLNFPDVGALAYEFPVVAQAMGALVYASSLLVPYHEAMKALAAIGDDEELTGDPVEDAEITARNAQRAVDRVPAQAAIDAARAALGA